MVACAFRSELAGDAISVKRDMVGTQSVVAIEKTTRFGPPQRLEVATQDLPHLIEVLGEIDRSRAKVRP